MFLKRSVHTICIAVMKAIQQYINTGCQKNYSKKKNSLYVELTDKSFAHIVSEYEDVGCVSTLSLVAKLLLFHFHGGEH